MTTETPEPSLSALAAELAYCDSRDLLQAAAGLQLMSENAGRTIRLEALAHVAASLPYAPDKPRISMGRLKAVCRSAALEALAPYEDPLGNPFVETLTFYGGSFLVLPGIVDDATFILRLFIEGVFFSPLDIERQYLLRARALLSAVLAVSDAIARKAGIDRGCEAPDPPGDAIDIPFADRLAVLKDAVCFSESELRTLLERHTVDIANLEPLTTSIGTSGAQEFVIANGPLLIRPIVHAGDRWIVALPGSLLSACRHELIRLAHQMGVADQLSRCFSLAAWRSVCTSLGVLDHHQLECGLPRLPDGLSEAVDGIFQFDQGKLAYSLLLTDALDAYDPASPHGAWPTPDFALLIDQRLDDIERYLFTVSGDVHEVFFLVIVQGVGRQVAMGFDRPKGPVYSPFLHLSAADLETIAFLEGGDSLALWKYAKACSRLRDKSRVICTDAIDEFTLYRQKGYNFYISEGAAPDFLWIPPGSGALKKEVIRRRDWHAARSTKRGHFIEVTCLHDTRAAPIYIPKSIIHRPLPRAEVLVEGLPLPVWVVGPARPGDRGVREVSFVFTESLAYWIWQFTPCLLPLFRRVELGDVLLVELAFEGDWSGAPVEADPANPPVRVVPDVEGWRLDITIHSSFGEMMGVEDNRGERELMRLVLESFRDFAPEEAEQLLSDQRIAEYLDLYAPLGRKKKILVSNTLRSPTLDRRGLPSFRKVQEADENDLLDEAGEYLIQEKGYAIGPIARDCRVAVLNSVVQYLYSRLERLVASLDPAGLLEDLVARHEAILQEIAQVRLTIPTRLACFSTMDEMLTMIGEELPARNKAAMAARFILEYVAARPPRGIRPLSMEVYDRLQALAHEIIDHGQLSDSLRFNLADFDMEILGSRRFGMDRGQLEKVREAFLPVQAHGELIRAQQGFHRHWRRSTPQNPPSTERSDLDEAVRIELGYSLREFNDFFATASSIGSARAPGVCALDRQELVRELSRELGWTEGSVGFLLDQLSLSPRPRFLAPPAPHRAEDVYPWRFNRSLSYLRRPFLVRPREGGEPEVIWGPRQALEASIYLTMICLTGKLRAQSLEMKQAISRYLNVESEEFNDLVADFFEQDQRLVVRRRLKKIGARRGQLEQLGDIDVLVVDPKRRTLLVIECKDLAGARTFYEMGNELQEFFIETSGRRSILSKHARRVEWVKDNLEAVLSEVGITAKRKWIVNSLIVVDHELLSPYFRQCPVKIVPFEQLKAS